MEWCPMCQVPKPIQLYKSSEQWMKRCRDCNSMMGMATPEDMNKIIVERDFYKSKFYEGDLKCKKSQD